MRKIALLCLLLSGCASPLLKDPAKIMTQMQQSPDPRTVSLSTQNIPRGSVDGPDDSKTTSAIRCAVTKWTKLPAVCELIVSYEYIGMGSAPDGMVAYLPMPHRVSERTTTMIDTTAAPCTQPCSQQTRYGIGISEWEMRNIINSYDADGEDAYTFSIGAGKPTLEATVSTDEMEAILRQIKRWR